MFASNNLNYHDYTIPNNLTDITITKEMNNNFRVIFTKNPIWRIFPFNLMKKVIKLNRIMKNFEIK